MKINRVGLAIEPEVNCIDISSKSVNPIDRPLTLFFLDALKLIVCIDTPFLKTVIVPVEFELALTDSATNSQGSATINGLLFDGLLEKNSSHLPVLAVPSNPQIVAPLDAFAAAVSASSIACWTSVAVNPFVELSNGTDFATGV